LYISKAASANAPSPMLSSFWMKCASACDYSNHITKRVQLLRVMRSRAFCAGVGIVETTPSDQ
jgi:hypothetical protein